MLTVVASNVAVAGDHKTAQPPVLLGLIAHLETPSKMTSSTSRIDCFAHRKAARSAGNLPTTGPSKSEKYAMIELNITRRDAFGGLAAGVGLAMAAHMVRPAHAQSTGKTFVLIHGAWVGG
jgi:hypothetical protein